MDYSYGGGGSGGRRNDNRWRGARRGGRGSHKRKREDPAPVQDRQGGSNQRHGSSPQRGGKRNMGGIKSRQPGFNNNGSVLSSAAAVVAAAPARAPVPIAVPQPQPPPAEAVPALLEGPAAHGGGNRQPGYDNRGSTLSTAAAAAAALARAPAPIAVPPPQPPPPPPPPSAAPTDTYSSESSLLYSFDEEEEEEEQEQSRPMPPLLPLDIQYTLCLLAMLDQLGPKREKRGGIEFELLGTHEYDEQAQSSSSPSSSSSTMFNNSNNNNKFKWNALSTFVLAVCDIYKYGAIRPPTHAADLQKALGCVNLLRPRAALLLYAASSSSTGRGGEGGGGGGGEGGEGGRQVAGGIIVGLRLEGPLLSDESWRREGYEGEIPRSEQRTLVVQLFYVCEGLEEVELSALCLVARLALAMQADSLLLTQGLRIEDTRRQVLWKEKYGAQMMHSKKKGMEVRFMAKQMRALLEREKEG